MTEQAKSLASKAIAAQCISSSKELVPFAQDLHRGLVLEYTSLVLPGTAPALDAAAHNVLSDEFLESGLY